MGLGLTAIAKQIYSFTAPSFWLLTGLFAVLAAGNFYYFGGRYPYGALLAVAIVINPATFGAGVAVLILLIWEKNAIGACHRASDNVERTEQLIDANNRFIRRIELLARRRFMKGGMFLAFWLHGKSLENSARRHQVNATLSAQDDLVHQQITDFYKFFGTVCRFISSLASHSSKEKSRKALEVCFAEAPFNTRSGRLKKSVMETYLDGDGFLSTLNFLNRLSLTATLEPIARKQIIQIFEKAFPKPASYGWLGSRFFEYILLRAIRGEQLFTISSRVSDLTLDFNMEAAKSEDELQVKKVKWEIRDTLLRENGLPTR